MHVDVDKMKLIGNTVLVEIVEEAEQVTKNGIVIPETAVVKEVTGGALLLEGVVHDFGPSVVNPEFSKGDLVLFDAYNVKHAVNDSFVIVSDEQIFAIINEEFEYKKVKSYDD